METTILTLIPVTFPRTVSLNAGIAGSTGKRTTSNLERTPTDMSGQISSRRWHLSTKQNQSGNECGDVPTKIQTSNHAMDHRDWPGKQRLAEHQACHCTHLQCFLQTVKHFWRLISSIFCFLNESFLFQNSTLCRQNRIFVDMSYRLKITVLSSILSTKHLSTTALLFACPLNPP